MNNLESKTIISPAYKKPISFSPRIKLAIMASGKGSNFNTILTDIQNGYLDADIICLIVNNKNCGAYKIAKKNSIPILYLDHNCYVSRQEFDKAIINKLNNFYVEGIVMVGWNRIVTNILLNEYQGRVVNLHPSLLPSFKGNNAIKKAIEANVCISGCTVHLVEEKVDSGEILIQSAVPIDIEDDETSLLRNIQIQEHKIISIGISLAAQKWRRNI
ncbi:phosphoribosylglycinamide formyltransferase [Prochlorococcus marinus]|uniref:phosphoribosylglycinamide formyltransferase n=1 Tax=Prochlorococcus marinus TaxID=1219 RepID=UPI0022B54419|nr:phosphoribosylglycinamide formyltransferase [Prochlorococcus marinus]